MRDAGFGMKDIVYLVTRISYLVTRITNHALGGMK
jgi:hypothetical protein